MGEIADGLIDGEFDYISGEYIGKGVGYPRTRYGDNQHKQTQAQRMKYAKDKITSLGYEITKETESQLSFVFNGSTVIMNPYTGWHTGKSIKDGRGIQNLLNQLT